MNRSLHAGELSHGSGLSHAHSHVQPNAGCEAAYHSAVPVVRLNQSVGLRALLDFAEGRSYIHLIAMQGIDGETVTQNTARIQGLGTLLQVRS